MAGLSKRARASRAVLLAVLVPLLTVAGCGLTDSPGSGDTTVRAALAADPTVDDGLRTVSWGWWDEGVSVLVRNDTDRVLLRGDAVVRLLDRRGSTLASSAAIPAQDACCAAAEVPPGATFGLYLQVDPHVASGSAVDDVAVDFTDVAWSVAEPGAAVTARPVELTIGTGRAVAVADLTTGDDPVQEAVVQATLDDADGRLLTVITGRWSCLPADATTRAFIEYFHQVPPGTVLGSVSVFPVEPTLAASLAC